MVQIQHKKSGNCSCATCGKTQDGGKMHGWTVWHKADDEKRGHQEPVCSLECATKLAEIYKAKENKIQLIG